MPKQTRTTPSQALQVVDLQSFQGAAEFPYKQLIVLRTPIVLILFISICSISCIIYTAGNLLGLAWGCLGIAWASLTSFAPLQVANLQGLAWECLRFHPRHLPLEAMDGAPKVWPRDQVDCEGVLFHKVRCLWKSVEDDDTICTISKSIHHQMADFTIFSLTPGFKALQAGVSRQESILGPVLSSLSKPRGSPGDTPSPGETFPGSFLSRDPTALR